VLTAEGIQAAVFYTKTFNRIVRPLHAVDTPVAASGLDPTIRRALATLDVAVADYAARSGVAA